LQIILIHKELTIKVRYLKERLFTFKINSVNINSLKTLLTKLGTCQEFILAHAENLILQSKQPTQCNVAFTSRDTRRFNELRNYITCNYEDCRERCL